jgi:alpha-glucosidase (family GH31 glycosyl hydrolase)
LAYTYTLAAEARETGMPLMRAMWLHYSHDERPRGLGTQYLWGRDLLIAPVFAERSKTSGDLDLPGREFTVELLPEGKSQQLHYDGRWAQVSF